MNEWIRWRVIEVAAPEATEIGKKGFGLSFKNRSRRVRTLAILPIIPIRTIFPIMSSFGRKRSSPGTKSVDQER